MELSEIIIHTDGGARGNPGPAACAFVAKKNGGLIGKESIDLGKTTNNAAEYQGVLLALNWILRLKEFDLNTTTISFYLDSELIVKQIIGLYKVKNENLKKINLNIKNIINNNKLKINFYNIPRSQNKEADFLVNKELDGRMSG
ncbi:MAG: Ribonuclease H [Microgenomates group bacterium GW2011_GWC1_39_7b]|uniref:Ribonuclease H n=3 Tax=Candidatus Woeseibacteriota TaxID=1752722 RepID=A0A0G0PS50_9BACT|nr:MAG: Ribonuclease H [Candidatus Woesebacteria bacterium GW2011_GWB1_39_10]KKR26778.1 MAG: Ribonuclease H [Microgenomates group bacterium GW2011_GWC1_39_7b]KKR72631.1 MAG: Ribonuclease H [Candidatus Woesebacteria bacterium GW2011_GWA2_40_7]KKS91126.1 MAG: Ribonuclease H [Candidatus Woesebacteria bacterium GW2011_GWA1_43_12]